MTIKTVGFVPRRRDIDRAAFRRHYEERHAPLAAPLFRFRRYRRNHLVDPRIEPGFDCLSEFWVESLEDIGVLMAGEAGRTMRADETLFVDQTANLAAVADPVLVGHDRATRLMLIHDEGGDRAALTDAARAATAGLDFLSPLGEIKPPCAAILRVGGAAPSLPPGWRGDPPFEVEVCETPADQLRA